MTSRSKTFFFFFLLLLVLSLFLLLFLFPIFSPTHLRQTERSSGDRRCIQMALSKEYSKGGGERKRNAHTIIIIIIAMITIIIKGRRLVAPIHTLMRVRTLMHNRDRPRIPHHPYTEGLFYNFSKFSL